MSIPNLLREELRGMLAGRYDVHQQGNLRSLVRAMRQQLPVANPQTMQPHPLETRIQVLTDGIAIDDRVPLNLLLRAIRCHVKVVSLEDQIAELEGQILKQRALFDSPVKWEKRHAISQEKMLVEKQQKLKAQCDNKSVEAQQYTLQVETRLEAPFDLPSQQPPVPAPRVKAQPAISAPAPMPPPRTSPSVGSHAFAMAPIHAPAPAIPPRTPPRVRSHAFATAQIPAPAPAIPPRTPPRVRSHAFAMAPIHAPAPAIPPKTPPSVRSHAFAMAQIPAPVIPPRTPPSVRSHAFATAQMPFPVSTAKMDLLPIVQLSEIVPPLPPVRRPPALPRAFAPPVAPRPAVPFGDVPSVLPRAFDPNAKLPSPPLNKVGFSLFNLRPSSIGRKKARMASLGGLLKKFSSDPNLSTAGDDKGVNAGFLDRYQIVSEISNPIAFEQEEATEFALLGAQKKSTRRIAPLLWSQFPPPHLAPLNGQERLPQARDSTENVVIRQAQTGRVFLANSTRFEQAQTLRDILLVYENNLADLNPAAIVDFNPFLAGVGLMGSQTRLPIATVNALLQTMHEIILTHPTLSNLQTTLTILMRKDLGQVPAGYPPQDKSLRLSDLFPLDQVTPPFLSTPFGQYYINAFTNKDYRGLERHNLRFVLLNFVEVLRQLAAFASVCLTRLTKENTSKIIDPLRGGVQRRDGMHRSDSVKSRSGIQSRHSMQSRSDVQSRDSMQSRSRVQSRDSMQSRSDIQSRDGVQRRGGVQRREGVQRRALAVSPLLARRAESEQRAEIVHQPVQAREVVDKKPKKALMPNFDLSMRQKPPLHQKPLPPLPHISRIHHGDVPRVGAADGGDDLHASVVGVNACYKRAGGRWDKGQFIPGQVVNGEFEPITSSLTHFALDSINRAVSDVAYVAGFPEDINSVSPDRASEIRGFAQYLAYELNSHRETREFDGSKFTFDAVLVADPVEPNKKGYRLKPEAEFAPYYRFRNIKSASATMITHGETQDRDIYLPLRMNRLVVGGQQVGKALSLPKLVNMDKFYNYLFEEKVPAVHMLLQEMDFNGAEVNRLTNELVLVNNEKVPDWHYANNMPRYHMPVTDYDINDSKIHMYEVGVLARDGSKGKNVVRIPANGFSTPDHGKMYVESKKGRIFNLGEESETQEYELMLTKNGVTRNIKLLHSPSWKDMTAIKPDQLQKLVDVRKEAFAGMPLGDVVTHCRAGVGRTGTVVAAEVMMNLGTSLFETVASLRDSRCGKMVQTATQGEALALWAMSRGLPILSDVK